jgi:ribosomal protein L32
MGNGTYQLILEGVAEGFDLEEVKKKLAAIFRTRPDKVAAFFTGEPVVVKKGLDNAKALKYKAIFEGAGASCRIEALEEAGDIPAHMIEEGEDDIPAHMIEEGEDDIPAHMIEDGTYTKEEDNIPARTVEESTDASKSREQESMVCPKCGHKQIRARTCISCGINVERFFKLMEKKAKEREEEEIHHEVPKVVLGIDRKFYEQADEAKKKGTDQTGFISNLLSDGRRLVILGAIAFFVILGFIEFFILRGDLVARDSIRIDRSSDYITILVDYPYQEYLVEVSTGKEERKLSFLLEDPIGRIIYEDTEYSLYKGSRRFNFEPYERGTYTLYINDGAIGFGERGYAKVRVFVNDNRILGRIFEFLNF